MLKTLLAPVALALGIVFPMNAAYSVDKDEAAKPDAGPVLAHTMKSIDGKEVDLSKYKGKVLLITNVASYCGATPQYKDLQALHEKYGMEGLAVIGVPCNQFGEQEPGTEKEIVAFCEKNYKVTFDMLAKVDVNGEAQAPLFKYLTSETAYPKDAGKVKWNFEKFLIGKDGKVAARFRTGVKPSDPAVVKAIEAELAKK